MIDVWEAVGLQFDIDGKRGIGIGNLIQPLSISLGKSFFGHPLQEGARMNGRDEVVALKDFSLSGSNVLHMTVVDFHPFYFCMGEHLSSCLFDQGNKQLGKMFTSAFKPAGALDVESGDNGVDKGWRLVL